MFWVTLLGVLAIVLAQYGFVPAPEISDVESQVASGEALPIPDDESEQVAAATSPADASDQTVTTDVAAPQAETNVAPPHRPSDAGVAPQIASSEDMLSSPAPENRSVLAMMAPMPRDPLPDWLTALTSPSRDPLARKIAVLFHTPVPLQPSLAALRPPSLRFAVFVGGGPRPDMQALAPVVRVALSLPSTHSLSDLELAALGNGTEPALPDPSTEIATPGQPSLEDADGAVATPAERSTALPSGTLSDAPPPVNRPEVEAATSPDSPTFDLVRIDAFGGGIIAGRAKPGATVRVMANGIEIATAEASNRGEFVAFVQTPDSDEGQALSLQAESQAGAILASASSIFILPTATAAGLEDEAPALLQATEESVRVLQPSGFGTIDRVTLDTISYDAEGTLVMAGRGTTERSVRIYVDGAPTAETAISEGGTWEAALDGLPPGRYIVRVDEIDADGQVSSRVESPFQRVFPEAALLAAAAPSRITVQPGNTLWAMARDRYGRGVLYTVIYDANKDAIRDPDLIYPGQIFALPEGSTQTR